jgi:hypothetical protein
VGGTLAKMCELENLTLYADTVDNYTSFLKEAGFADIQIRNENNNYRKYNENIVKKLNSPDYSKFFIEKFGEKSWHEAIEAYNLISKSIKDNELLIRWFKCHKNPNNSF